MATVKHENVVNTLSKGDTMTVDEASKAIGHVDGATSCVDKSSAALIGPYAVKPEVNEVSSLPPACILSSAPWKWTSSYRFLLCCSTCLRSLLQSLGFYHSLPHLLRLCLEMLSSFSRATSLGLASQRESTQADGTRRPM